MIRNCVLPEGGLRAAAGAGYLRADVRIAGGRITAIAGARELGEADENVMVVDGTDKLLLPGFRWGRRVGGGG